MYVRYGKYECKIYIMLILISMLSPFPIWNISLWGTINGQIFVYWSSEKPHIHEDKTVTLTRLTVSCWISFKRFPGPTLEQMPSWYWHQCCTAYSPCSLPQNGLQNFQQNAASPLPPCYNSSHSLHHLPPHSFSTLPHSHTSSLNG
jgi:hypothetical protein